MKAFKVSAAAWLVAVSPTLSYGRQAEVRNFNGSSVAFQMIEPGFSPDRQAAPDDPRDGSDALELSREFASWANEPSAKSAPKIVESLRIPAWMRSSAKAMMPNVYLPAYASMPLENCGAVKYAPHPALNASQELRRQRYFQEMVAAACGAGVPVELFDALIIQESRYNPLSLSSKGASGLTQLMPGTARSLGVFDRWSVTQNLSGGARYLRKQLDTFGNWSLALGAYNAGPGNITKYGGLPPFRETRGYVRTILASIISYQATKGHVGTPPFEPRRAVMLASFNR